MRQAPPSHWKKAQMHSMSAASPLNSIAPCSPFSATSAAWKLSAASVIEYLDGTYQSFVAQYLDKSDYLFTISLAHILLARDRRNLFSVLFLSNEYGSRTVPQIISSPWNREAIDCTAVQYGLTVKEAEAVYRDVRFYTFGIAEALYAGSLIAEENELRQLLRGAIRKFCAK